MSSSRATPPPRTFTLFSALPRELQLEILRYACANHRPYQRWDNLLPPLGLPIFHPPTVEQVIRMVFLAEEAFHELVPEEHRGPPGTARVSAFLSAMRARFPTRVSLMRTSGMARMAALEAWVRDIEGTAAMAEEREHRQTPASEIREMEEKEMMLELFRGLLGELKERMERIDKEGEGGTDTVALPHES